MASYNSEAPVLHAYQAAVPALAANFIALLGIVLVLTYRVEEGLRLQ